MTTRRDFFKKSAMGTAALTIGGMGFTRKSYASIIGANNRVNVAVIGIRGMGQSHISAYQGLKDVEVAALCDVDTNLFAERVKKHFTDKNLRKPKLYDDMRKLFENKDIDAVSVTTPNHWHSLTGIWAVQAGKHASIEKPCCHTIEEGKRLVAAAKRYGKVVQDGAEQRSNPCAQSAVEYLHSGKLGEVYMAKGLCYKWRDNIGRYPDGYMQEGETYSNTVGGSPMTPYTKAYMDKVNYDMWLGPAPLRPFNRNRFHYNWHWFWDYGNGDLGNQGVHEMDVARWGLGVKIPTKVSAMGGMMMFDCDQETPNNLMAVFEFDNPDGGGDKKRILQFEVRNWMTNSEGGKLGADEGKNNSYMTSASNKIGNLFYGSKGYMTKDVSSWQTYMGRKHEIGDSGKGAGNHYQNFIDAIRANDRSKLTAPIEEGFYSCALIHLANISYRLGRTLYIDPVKFEAKNDPEANGMFSKQYRAPYVLPVI